MEQKNSIILKVDESTKKIMSELEERISDGFSDTLGELKEKIRSSSDAIESLKVKLNRINDIQDSVDKSSSKSDEIKHGVENLIKAVSSQLKVDVEKCASDDPLDKHATKGDIEKILIDSLANLDSLKDSLLKTINSYGERNSVSFAGFYSLIENIKSTITSIQKKQVDIADDVTSDFQKTLATIEVQFSQCKEQIINIEDIIKNSIDQTGLNIRQQFENSQAERMGLFEQNQSTLQSQSTQLYQNAEMLHDILEALSTSFMETDNRLKELADSLAASHISYSKQIGVSFDSSRNEIKSEFAHLNATICENDNKLIAVTNDAIVRITNDLLAAKAEILSDNLERISQTLSSINELRAFINARVSSIENDCSAISKEVESLNESMANKFSIIKENQENIQQTLNEVLFHSIPFWRFKARKAVKKLNIQ